jgi:hypothetical protein
MDTDSATVKVCLASLTPCMKLGYGAVVVYEGLAGAKVSRATCVRWHVENCPQARSFDADVLSWIEVQLDSVKRCIDIDTSR